MGMLDKARMKARKAIELLYEHNCNVRAYEKYKDTVTKETKIGINPVPKYENEPCKVSQKILGKNNQSDTTNEVTYEIKLFISPEIDIHQGDEVEATQFARTTKYKAGESFIYASHQEVILSKDGKA